MKTGLYILCIFCINKTMLETLSEKLNTLESKNCLCQLGWRITYYKRCFTSVKSKLLLSNRSPLHIAARYGVNECIPTLLHLGSMLEAKDKDGATPLALAIWGNYCSTVKILLNNGANRSNLMKNAQEKVDRCLIKTNPHKIANLNDIGYGPGI